MEFAGGGIDEDGDLRPERTEGNRPFVGPDQAQGQEDSENFGLDLDDGDGPQEAGAEGAAQGFGAPDLLDQFAPGGAAASRTGRWSVNLARSCAGNVPRRPSRTKRSARPASRQDRTYASIPRSAKSQQAVLRSLLLGVVILFARIEP